MAKNKVLNLSNMGKMDKKAYDVTFDIDVKGYSVTVDRVFRPSKMANLMKEMLQKAEDLAEQGIDLFNAFDMTLYGMLLMVKHFTSIDVPDKFEDQIRVLNIMIDNELLEPVVDAFDEEELLKVKNFVQKATKNLENRVEELNEANLEILGPDKEQEEVTQETKEEVTAE